MKNRSQTLLWVVVAINSAALGYFALSKPRELDGFSKAQAAKPTSSTPKVSGNPASVAPAKITPPEKPIMADRRWTECKAVSDCMSFWYACSLVHVGVNKEFQNDLKSWMNDLSTVHGYKCVEPQSKAPKPGKLVCAANRCAVLPAER